MQLADWLAGQRNAQNAFVRYWLKGSEDNFPLELPIDEWDEQFSVFHSQRRKSEAKLDNRE